MATTASSKPARTKAAKDLKQKPERPIKPREDQIRIHAYDLFKRRQVDGINGDAASDWFEAERELA